MATPRFIITGFFHSVCSRAGQTKRSPSTHFHSKLTTKSAIGVTWCYDLGSITHVRCHERTPIRPGCFAAEEARCRRASRARKLPIDHERNDLRQLGLGLLWLDKRNIEPSMLHRLNSVLTNHAPKHENKCSTAGPLNAAFNPARSGIHADHAVRGY
jgi:hypothetical protein